MCTRNSDDRKLENTVKQSRFKHLGELHKEWTEAGVSASRVNTLRHLQEKGYQATSETWTSSEASYLGYGEKELDCCSVVQSPLNVQFNLEIKVPESGEREERHRIHVAWGPVWSFHSQWWFGLPCHLLVLVHCVFWSTQSTQPSTRKFYLIPNSPDLNPIENLDERHQTQQYRWAEGRYQSYLGFITPEQCHGLIVSMPRRIDAIIHAKGGPTKYWVMNILFRSLTFLFKIALFYWSYVIFYIIFLRHWIWGFHYL